jgi:hypothetical protein
MLGLTLWRPWDLLIARGLKKIENRPWQPGRALQPGDRFAIHAGKHFDETCIPKAQHLGVPIAFFSGKWAESAVVAVVTFAGVVTTSDDDWFTGPFGWILESPVILDRPVPCRGYQGLWTLPPLVEMDVAEQCRGR